jgi:myo-inositol-1(or 4)-monophosphatase
MKEKKMNSIKGFLDFALLLAGKAGEIIKKGFSADKKVVFKSFANPVTDFDKASEELITGMIEKNFPSHSILTEEELSRRKNSDIKWIIDPLDGTVNFIHRIPFIGISIGIEIEGEIIAGVVYNPVLEEWYWALKGGGAFFNRKEIHVSAVSERESALIATGFPYETGDHVDSLLMTLSLITNNFNGFRRIGSASLDLCYVARGSFDGFYQEKLNPWDTAAGKIIVQEAGGVLSNYAGEKFDIYGKTMVADNGIIHNSILDVIKVMRLPG